jgi:hypothetical protein
LFLLKTIIDRFYFINAQVQTLINQKDIEAPGEKRNGGNYVNDLFSKKI